MIKMTLNVEGMACQMCEAHINDAVRRDFKVKKVTHRIVKYNRDYCRGGS